MCTKAFAMCTLKPLLLIESTMVALYQLSYRGVMLTADYTKLSCR
nr:MAG TPA: hypothetical protein [Caudoviricetes sp.]